MAAMTFTARGEWTETVVTCDACGEEISFCNKDLCGGEYPPDYEFYESAALKMAAENHECARSPAVPGGEAAMMCPDCQHAAHAGRCFCIIWRGHGDNSLTPTHGDNSLIPTQCSCKERCKEDSDGDSVLDSTEPDRPVAGPRTVEDVAGRLAVLGQRLMAEGESMQRQIAAIRQTIADYHAEMRRIQKAEP